MLSDSSFRRESARLTASLVRSFGPSNLQLAEDVVQETFVRAMQEWSLKGVPPSPSAWLSRVARNLAVDRLRRERIYVGEKALEFASFNPQEPTMMEDELAMLLMCAHPSLAAESQIALTLKTVCGLGVGEIAKGLLTTEAAVSQRLTRAKAALRGVEFGLSTDLDARLETVTRVLYLLFNEGYLAASGDSLVNAHVCNEAILLTHRLVSTRQTNRPEVHALVALMLLHSSRLPSRVDSDGALCLLEDQDRTQWDHGRIAAGLNELLLGSRGNRLSPYHCEAAIAACHAAAPSFAETDWAAVLSHYDDLLQVNPNAIARLNRAVALSMVHGDEAALLELDRLSSESRLQRYYLLPATRARFLERLGRIDEANAEYNAAFALATNEAERRYLAQKIVRRVAPVSSL